MFDTMTLTKAFGSLCAALLVFLLGKWIADAMYVPGSRNLPPAFVIDTGVDDDDGVEVVELTFDEAFAQADADAGTRLWGQCRACHVIDDARNGVGPYLLNVMGREIGAVSGFNYSGALPDGEWTASALSGFIANPRSWAPGTSMSYAGMSSVTDRANLIAYIATFSPDWIPDAGIDESAAEPEAPAEDAVEEAAVEPEATEEDAAAADDAAAAEEEAAAEATDEAVTDEAAAEPAEEAASEEAAVDAAEEAATETAEVTEPEATEPEATDVAEAAEAETTEPEAVETEAVETEVAEAAETDATEAEAVEPEVAEAEVSDAVSPIAAAFADADLAAGARVWRQCQACHVADRERNLIGPHLVGVIGREVGTIDGFRYSGRLPEGVWTLEELDLFLTNPRAYAPGTTMAFNGLRDLADRANVLAHIDAQN